MTSATPAEPTNSPTPQPLSFAGSGFAAPLTLSSPAGLQTPIPATRLRNVTATSFEVDLTLDSPGDWTLELTNADGRRSALFIRPVA